jgi:hypothetical protein
MITPKTQVSGTSSKVVVPVTAPDRRPHPAYPIPVSRDIAEPLLKDLLCYHIEDYGSDGISVLIDKKDDNFLVTFADWYGLKIELTDTKSRLKDLAADFLGKNIAKLLNVMRMIRLNTAMYYFAIDSESEFVLVDVMLNPNKMCGPGMVRDVFGKLFKTQSVKLVDKYNQDLVNSKNLIVKPSMYRTVLVGGVEFPLYMRS